MFRTIFIAVFAVFVFSGVTYAEEAKKIQDNSFLIEEAYNQEDGVVQHIQSFQYFKKSKTWLYTFTQEWPVLKQTHQLSYTIPVARIDGEKEFETGLGDIALNYRYQFVNKASIAVAPRLSLLLPTGDYKKGLGSGAVGFQANLPLSVELSDTFVSHWNLGYTFIPNGKDTDRTKVRTHGFNYGASIIWLATENFNLMLEAAGNSTRFIKSDGETHEDSFFLNPGMRFAVNFKSGLQIVPGISFPIGVGPSKGEYGTLFYLSFEHPLF